MSDLIKVHSEKLRDETKLRRFVDLPKFLQLLVKERLFFPSLDQLAKGDPFEASISNRVKYEQMDLAALRNRALQLLDQIPHDVMARNAHERRKRALKLLDSMDNDLLIDSIIDLEIRQFRSGIVCSCWHEGDGESDAMWKIYAAHPGVCIESTVGRLKESFENIYILDNGVVSARPSALEIARVEYVGDQWPGFIEPFYFDRPWLLKRKAFEHEKEVRISHTVSNMVTGRKGLNFQVHLDRLLETVVLSPFNPTWVNDVIISTIGAVRPTISCGLSISRHMTEPDRDNPLVSILRAEELAAQLRKGGWSLNPPEN